ncbi:MAG: CHASE3 domain-containing protein, partial [Deltaproteobacteria bacterium]|nr:CHASE3 domain-containing protein [Deltaproteobacteria bacterium]
MRFGNLKLRTKVMAGGVVPIILLVVLSVAGAVSLRSLVKDIYRVDLTHKVIRNTVEIESQVTDLLTALRGYLLTGDTTFLESFNTEENVVRQGLLALEKLVRHDEAQTKLLKEFQEVIEKWKTESVAPAIALRKEITAGKNINDMAMLVVEGKGKQYFDTFRHQTNSFVSRERSRLDKWRTEAATEASVEQLSTAFSLVDYENTLILQAMEILVTALDMEIGQRGYLLSGKEEFLGPYEVESKRLFALIEKQKKAVGEHPDQVKLLEEMEAGMRDWVNNVAEPEIRIR